MLEVLELTEKQEQEHILWKSQYAQILRTRYGASVQSSITEAEGALYDNLLTDGNIQHTPLDYARSLYE